MGKVGFSTQNDTVMDTGESEAWAKGKHTWFYIKWVTGTTHLLELKETPYQDKLGNPMPGVAYMPFDKFVELPCMAGVG